MYTPWTIDTYSTFDFDSHDESEIDYYNEEHNTSYTYDDFDWTYNHKGLVQCLASNWLDFVQKNIIDDVILAIEPDGEPWSPREYNFSTDNQNIIFTVNIDALKKYIFNNVDDYNVNKIQDRSGFWWMGDDEQTMLNYYLRTKSEQDYTQYDYYSDQLDQLQSNGQLYDFVSYELIKS